MGQYQVQDPVRVTDGAGRNCWDLDHGWLCIWGKRVEDAHPGSDLPTHTVCGGLVVFDLHILQFRVTKCWNSFVALKLKLATYLFLVPGGFQNLRDGSWPMGRRMMLISIS